MTFEEWLACIDHPDSIYSEFLDGARAAWDAATAQLQTRIDELEAENKRILDHAVELSMTVPEGYALVPVESTAAMCAAFWAEYEKEDWFITRAYKAMVAAAQKED